MQKTVIIALAVVATLTGYYLLHIRPTPTDPSTDAIKNVYNQWKVDYNINVGASENDYRFKVFSSNYQKIVAHNAIPSQTFKMGLNPFTYLTTEEFAATHLGLKEENEGPARRNATVPLPHVAGKKNIDWTPKLNPVKDQAHCGSCWAFATVGAIEGAHSVLKGNLYNLAEQELVDCSGDYGNMGCNGGLADQGFQYVISAEGLATESEYPYTAVDGNCKSDIKTRQGKISNYVDVTEASVEDFKAALAQQPLAVAVQADQDIFHHYSSGVITGDSCGTELDHAIVAVGYNDEAEQPYYKVRNSWGTKWGEEGYVRIGIQEGAGVCGIQLQASYPTF